MDRARLMEVINRVADPRLKEALLVVSEYLSGEPIQERNETSWSIDYTEDEYEGDGLQLMLYQF